MEIALSSNGNSDIYICSDRKLFDFECAYEVVLMSENPGKLLVLLNHLNGSVSMFGMNFSLPKRKMLLHDWIRLEPNLAFCGKRFSMIDKFNSLINFISPIGRILDKVSSRTKEAFTSLRHL